MESVMQLEQNLKIAESYTPMTDAERLAFFRDILPLVRPEKMPWKQPVGKTSRMVKKRTCLPED